MAALHEWLHLGEQRRAQPGEDRAEVRGHLGVLSRDVDLDVRSQEGAVDLSPVEVQVEEQVLRLDLGADRKAVREVEGVLVLEARRVARVFVRLRGQAEGLGERELRACS